MKMRIGRHTYVIDCTYRTSLSFFLLSMKRNYRRDRQTHTNKYLSSTRSSLLVFEKLAENRWKRKSHIPTECNWRLCWILIVRRIETRGTKKKIDEKGHFRAEYRSADHKTEQTRHKCLAARVGAYERTACLLAGNQCASSSLREILFRRGSAWTLELRTSARCWLVRG